MKKLIAKEINVDIKALKFFYKEKEIKEDEDKNNLYQMIKDDTFPIIEVKKEILNEQNIISLNTKVNLVYKVECKQITDYIDFISKIEQFFKDICIENHYLCEPIANNKYNVCFLCSDHCFQFKRYMMNISRMEKLYEKSTYKVLGADKSQIIEPEVDLKNEEEDESYGKIEKIVVTDKKNNKDIEIQFRKIKHKENDYFQKDFINKGPYESEDTKKKQTDEKNKSKKKKKKEFTIFHYFREDLYLDQFDLSETINKLKEENPNIKIKYYITILIAGDKFKNSIYFDKVINFLNQCISVDNVLFYTYLIDEFHELTKYLTMGPYIYIFGLKKELVYFEIIREKNEKTKELLTYYVNKLLLKTYEQNITKQQYKLFKELYKDFLGLNKLYPNKTVMELELTKIKYFDNKEPDYIFKCYNYEKKVWNTEKDKNQQQEVVELKKKIQNILELNEPKSSNSNN